MKALMYSKSNCTYCKSAAQLLVTKGIQFDKVMVDEGDNLKELLARVPTAKTVPQIFIDDIYIGGLTQLKEYLNTV